jgi:hypothetical protein
VAITAYKEEVLNERRLWAHFGRTLVTGFSGERPRPPAGWRWRRRAAAAAAAPRGAWQQAWLAAGCRTKFQARAHAACCRALRVLRLALLELELASWHQQDATGTGRLESAQQLSSSSAAAAAAEVLESSRFDDFEAFMAAVQRLWDDQWEAVHAAPRHGVAPAPCARRALPACPACPCCRLPFFPRHPLPWSAPS